MKNILNLVDHIILQARCMADAVIDGLSALSSANPYHILSKEQLMNLYNIGYMVVVYNNLSGIDEINEEFQFEGFDEKCYLSQGDGYIQLALQLLSAIAAEKNWDISWYCLRHEVDNPADVIRVYWEYEWSILNQDEE